MHTYRLVWRAGGNKVELATRLTVGMIAVLRGLDISRSCGAIREALSDDRRRTEILRAWNELVLGASRMGQPGFDAEVSVMLGAKESMHRAGIMASAIRAAMDVAFDTEDNIIEKEVIHRDVPPDLLRFVSADSALRSDAERLQMERWI